MKQFNQQHIYILKASSPFWELKQLAIFVAACSFVEVNRRLCECAVRTIGQRHQVTLAQDCTHARHHTKSASKKIKKIKVAADVEHSHQIYCFLTLRLSIFSFRCLHGAVWSLAVWYCVVLQVEVSSICRVWVVRNFQKKHFLQFKNFSLSINFHWFLSCILFINSLSDFIWFRCFDFFFEFQFVTRKLFVFKKNVLSKYLNFLEKKNSLFNHSPIFRFRVSIKFLSGRVFIFEYLSEY